jgi:hypothetical protein
MRDHPRVSKIRVCLNSPTHSTVEAVLAVERNSARKVEDVTIGEPIRMTSSIQIIKYFRSENKEYD